MLLRNKDLAYKYSCTLEAYYIYIYWLLGAGHC